MKNFKIGVEKAIIKQQHKEFISCVHAESLRTWAKIATRKEKDKFIKMFKKDIEF